MALAVTAAGLAGCSSGGGVNTEDPVAAATSAPDGFASSSTPSVSPSSTPSPASEDEAILSAYRAFFTRQAEISRAPAEERKEMLEPFTTQPALDRVLRGMFAAEELGEVGYGEPVIDPEVESIDGDTATVTDCQDGREAGRKKRSDGEITTRGIEDAKVVVTAERGPDDEWRVASVDYPEEPC